MISDKKSSRREGSIYTLAQSGTEVTRKLSTTVVGKGSDITNTKTAKGRARRKLITQSMAFNLIDIVKEKRGIEATQPFWNTFYCQRKITSSNGRIYGRYCKNRFCTLCMSIRKAEIINKYLPVIETWEQPYFVTLTARSCSGRKLKARVKNMKRAFRIIKERQKKRHQRGKGIKLMGIKSLECNFNPDERTYNPHFHLIVPDKETADLFIKEWLNLWTSKHTSRKGQFARPVKDTTSDLIEIIKYGSKIFTEPDVNNKAKSKKKGSVKIYAAALDNILNAMKGHRIFDRFGFNLPKEENTKKSKSKVISDYDNWVFNLKKGDWKNVDSDEVLSDYCAPAELLYLLEFQVDKERT